MDTQPSSTDTPADTPPDPADHYTRRRMVKSLGLTSTLGIAGLLAAACGQATTSGSGSTAAGTGANTTAQAPAAPAKTAALKGKIEYWDWWNTADSPTHEA